jgi:hypothetical protein
MERAEVGQQVGQESIAERGRRGEAEQSIDFGAHRRYGPVAVVEGVPGLAGEVEVEPAGLGQGHAPGRAMQQLHAQARLQRADLFADLGLGQAQALGGPGEAAGLDHGQQSQGLGKSLACCFHGETD